MRGARCCDAQESLCHLPRVRPVHIGSQGQAASTRGQPEAALCRAMSWEREASQALMQPTWPDVLVALVVGFVAGLWFAYYAEAVNRRR